MKKQFPQKPLQTDRGESFFQSNVPGQNYSAKNEIKLMEQLQRVAGVKVVATADGGAPCSLDERTFFFVVVFCVFLQGPRRQRRLDEVHLYAND